MVEEDMAVAEVVAVVERVAVEALACNQCDDIRPSLHNQGGGRLATSHTHHHPDKARQRTRSGN